jgi:hypothetical protein
MNWNAPDGYVPSAWTATPSHDYAMRRATYAIDRWMSSGERLPDWAVRVVRASSGESELDGPRVSRWSFDAAFAARFSGAGNEIDSLYEDLRELASQPSSHGRDNTYRAKLSHLRKLERAETERMSTFFHARIDADRQEVDEASRRADKLLAQHEHPPAGH